MTITHWTLVIRRLPDTVQTHLEFDKWFNGPNRYEDDFVCKSNRVGKYGNDYQYKTHKGALDRMHKLAATGLYDHILLIHWHDHGGAGPGDYWSSERYDRLHRDWTEWTVANFLARVKKDEVLSN